MAMYKNFYKNHKRFSKWYAQEAPVKGFDIILQFSPCFVNNIDKHP